MGQPRAARPRGPHQLPGAPIGLLLAALLAQSLDSARFAHPPADVRPAMLWVWNGRITDSLIDRQLAEMRSAGLAEVIISPVGTERLDTARVAHAQREAQRIGMRASLASSHPELSGDTRRLRLREAASAAHLAGRPRIPAKLPVEEERSLTPQEARIRIGAMAARGVNLMVLHANSEREPWWFAMGDLVTWTARVSDLALGKSAAPMALLVPTPERERPGGALDDIVTKLEDAQADFDLLPEEALAEAKVRIGHLEAGPQRYRVVIVPPVQTLSIETARRLAAFSHGGGTVIAWKPLPTALEAASPPRGPRFRVLESGAQLIDTLIHTPFSTVREPGPPALRILPLERGEDQVFLLFNESDRRIKVAPPFRLIGQPELWNPDDGSMRLPPTRWSPRYALTDVPLELEPFQVLGLVFRARPRSPKGPITAPPTEDVVADATTGWRFRFATSDTTWRPAPLGSWTERDAAYSGTGIYEGTLEVEGGPRRAGDRYLLDLGAVREVAEVEFNEKALGRRLWRPYRYDVTDIVRPGTNRITIRVTNTLANQKGIALTSGLLGPVIIIRVRGTQ